MKEIKAHFEKKNLTLSEEPPNFLLPFHSVRSSHEGSKESRNSHGRIGQAARNNFEL